jgi:ADP-heptose:LPS heptosyltransferase
VNLLVFKVGALGDTVVFLPVVQTLRRLHPDWRITVVASPTGAPLYHGTIPPGDLIAVERGALKSAGRRPWRLFGWWRRVRRLRPDAVLLSWDQSSVARFLGATSGAGIRVGGADSVVRLRGGLTHTVAKDPAHSVAEWEWAMAGTLMDALGQPWAATPPAPVLPVPPATPPRAGRPSVVVHAGGSREYTRWSAERFAALARSLSADCDVVWIDLPEFSAPAPSTARVVRSPGLDELIRLLTGADLFVGNHSGPFHLAAALKCPCVIPTGPTFPAYDPPWHRERIRLLRATGVACMPCDRLTQGADVCRNTATPMACLDYWSVEVVASACRDLLGRFPRAGPSP